MLKIWTDEAWEDYMYWHEQNDKQVIKKINKLIRAIETTPYSGEGKPEPLKFELNGKWSRRITHSERLVYTIHDNALIIYACRYHYEK